MRRHLWSPADSFYTTVPIRPYFGRVINNEASRVAEGIATPMACIQVMPKRGALCLHYNYVSKLVQRDSLG